MSAAADAISAQRRGRAWVPSPTLLFLLAIVAGAWAFSAWAELSGAAAVWQLTPLMDACLRECRHPAAFLQRYYARGPRAGLVLGLRHAFFCLGCCWALMLVMFAAGVAHLAWMGALGLVMVAEKTFPGGDQLARPVGGILALLAAAALL